MFKSLKISLLVAMGLLLFSLKSFSDSLYKYTINPCVDNHHRYCRQADFEKKITEEFQLIIRHHDGETILRPSADDTFKVELNHEGSYFNNEKYENEYLKNLENGALIINQKPGQIEIGIAANRLSGELLKLTSKPSLRSKLYISIPTYYLKSVKLEGLHRRFFMGHLLKTNPSLNLDIQVEAVQTLEILSSQFNKLTVNQSELVELDRTSGQVDIQSDLLHGKVTLIDHEGDGHLISNTLSVQNSSGKMSLIYPECFGELYLGGTFDISDYAIKKVKVPVNREDRVRSLCTNQ